MPQTHNHFAAHGGRQYNAPGGTQNFGIPPEQLGALIAAAYAPLERQSAEQQAKIAGLSKSLGATEGIVRAVLATLAEHMGDLAPEALPAKVAELSRDRQELLARQQERASDPDAGMAELDRGITEAVASGDDARAQSLLEHKRDLKLAAAKQHEKAATRLQEAATRDLLAAAETEATLGDLALARLRYREAAERFSRAADLAPSNASSEIRLGYLDRAANALYRQGSEFGDNTALAIAIERYRSLLRERTRDRVPLDWARTQNNLAFALWELGRREAGTERLEEAVEVFRLALEEATRHRVPLEWARTQNNLALALLELGRREVSAERLEKAVDGFRFALAEATRDRVPLEWATTQNNLGSALWELGRREAGTERLEEAVKAYHLALEERTRDRVPLQWATTQNNLGLALMDLGRREAGAERLEEAVKAFRLALEERTRDRVLLDWAATQNNLDEALRVLGQRGGGHGQRSR